MEDGQATGTGWEYAADAPFYLDHVILQEDLSQGEAVRRFAIHIQTGVSGQLVTLYEGRNIGHKAICRFPLVACSKVVAEEYIRAEITEADRAVKLRSVSLHNSTGLIPQH